MSHLAMHDYRLELQSLKLKDHGWDIKKLHNHVDRITNAIKGAGEKVSDTDQIINLFQAYKTTTNAIFRQHVTLLESEWSRGKLTMPATLRADIESRYQDMVCNNKWKPPKAEKPEVTALRQKRQ